MKDFARRGLLAAGAVLGAVSFFFAKVRSSETFVAPVLLFGSVLFLSVWMLEEIKPRETVITASLMVRVIAETGALTGSPFDLGKGTGRRVSLTLNPLLATLIAIVSVPATILTLPYFVPPPYDLGTGETILFPLLSLVLVLSILGFRQSNPKPFAYSLARHWGGSFLDAIVNGISDRWIKEQAIKGDHWTRFFADHGLIAKAQESGSSTTYRLTSLGEKLQGIFRDSTVTSQK